MLGTGDFGIKMDITQETKIQQKLERLREKCPPHSSIQLQFEKRRSSVVGVLTIKTLSREFKSRKIGNIPILVFTLLEDDINNQLLDWKRTRFSASLEYKLSPNNIIKSA